jgi:hypothetical protein
MNDFDSDFEFELRESRPAPRGELLDSLVSKVSTRPAPVRKSRWQLRLAGVMAAAALVCLAGLGGVSAASDAAKHTTKAGHHEQGDDEHGGNGNGNGDDGDREDGDREHGDREHGRKVPVCLNGSTTVVYFKAKKANKIVLIKHRGVFATPGNPPTCPAI